MRDREVVASLFACSDVDDMFRVYRSLVLEAGWTANEYEAQLVRLLATALGIAPCPQPLSAH